MELRSSKTEVKEVAAYPEPPMIEVDLHNQTPKR